MTVTTINRPRLRVLPLPAVEPALGARAYQHPPIEGSLALSITTATAPRLDDHLFGPQPTPSLALPDPRPVAAFLFQAVVEVLAGRRSAGQLTRWMTHDVHTALALRATTVARVRGRGTTVRQAVVRAVRLCHPADGVVEASATVIDGGRVRAVAMRLEGLDGRWRVTALEVG